MTKSKEATLIEKYKLTENIQFVSDLYSPYMALVYGVCLKYLKNRELAQDAVMDIFEKLLSELIKHETPNNFKTWLYVVTKNFCLMKMRSDSSKSIAFKKIADEFMENGFSLHPIDEEEEKDMNPALKDCIEKLKENQKKAIELFYYKKLCYREIAENMKITEKKVKSDIQNAKRNLKICIEKEHA